MLFVMIGLLLGNRAWLTRIESDSLQIVSFYQDIFVDKYPARSWNLPSSPYFFPDMALLIPSLWAAQDIGYAYVAYSFIFFFSLLLVLATINATISRNWGWPLIAVFSLGLFFVSLSGQDNYPFLYYRFFYPSFHAGQILPGFLLVAISLRSANKGYSALSAAAFVLLAFPTIASDLIVVPQFILPLLMTAFLFFLLRLLPLSFFIANSLLSATAYVLAMLSIAALKAIGGFSIAGSFGRFSPNKEIFLANCSLFFRSMTRYWDAYPIFFVAFYAALGIAAFYLIVNRRHLFGRDRNDNSRTDAPRTSLLFLLVFSGISIIGTIVGPIAINRWAGDWCIHYIQVLYVFPILILALFLSDHAIRGFLWPKIALAIIILLGIWMLFSSGGLQAESLKLSYPSSVQCLDEAARNYGLKHGYGGYWHARFLTVHSREGLRVNQLDSDLQFFEWTNNNAWYIRTPGETDSTYPTYNFILVTPTTRMKTQEKFGEPAAIERCSGMEVYIYNRKSDIAFRNFLRIPALILNGRALPPSPIVPKQLGAFKPDGANPNVHDIVELPAHGEISAHFDPPVTGEVLEISADADHEFTLDFLAKDALVATLQVPKSSGSGLKIRYLMAPQAMQQYPVDRLVTRHIDGDAPARLGHIFVYDDSFLNNVSQ